VKSIFDTDIRDFVWKRELDFRNQIERLGEKALDKNISSCIRKAAVKTMEILTKKHIIH
tara:strand:- start:1 stop:177 length:177 start_codon:yes stop_codon:yes gene_type:complete